VVKSSVSLNFAFHEPTWLLLEHIILNDRKDRGAGSIVENENIDMLKIIVKNMGR
jgi:hypothetical protein